MTTDANPSTGTAGIDKTRARDDQGWMRIALDHARQSAAWGEVPVGAVLVVDGALVAAAGNSPIRHADPTAHAEIVVLREGGRILGNYRLVGATLYVTLEPCLMCMGAILHARIDRLVYGAADPKTGAAESLYQIGRDGRLNHRLVVLGGVQAAACGDLLRSFFRDKRSGDKRPAT